MRRSINKDTLPHPQARFDPDFWIETACFIVRLISISPKHILMTRSDRLLDNHIKRKKCFSLNHLLVSFLYYSIGFNYSKLQILTLSLFIHEHFSHADLSNAGPLLNKSPAPAAQIFRYKIPESLYFDWKLWYNNFMFSWTKKVTLQCYLSPTQNFLHVLFRTFSSVIGSLSRVRLCQ